MLTIAASALVNRPFHNLCQTSIFLDVVLAPLIAAPLFILLTKPTFTGPYLTWMFLLSPGCMFAFYCVAEQNEHASACSTPRSAKAEQVSKKIS